MYVYRGYQSALKMGKSAAICGIPTAEQNVVGGVHEVKGRYQWLRFVVFASVGARAQVYTVTGSQIL
jgi:hypothetical protein